MILTHSLLDTTDWLQHCPLHIIHKLNTSSMSKWSKIKMVKTMVKEKKDGEEEEEEDFLYEIIDLPDPKYKFKFLKPVTYFMR